MICMDSPALTLVVALVFAVTVESIQNVNHWRLPPFPRPPPPHPPPQPPKSPPTQPLINPAGSVPPRPPSLLPPPPSPFPPPRPPLRSSSDSHPTPRPSSTHPPPSSTHPPPQPPRKQHSPGSTGLSNHTPHRSLSPPTVKENANKGKKIGLMFVGVAAILQVCIVAFLLISRRQLFKNGY